MIRATATLVIGATSGHRAAPLPGGAGRANVALVDELAPGSRWRASHDGRQSGRRADGSIVWRSNAAIRSSTASR
jgi:hypothetical protein